MSRGSFLNDALYDYLLRATLAPEPLLDRLRDETTEKIRSLRTDKFIYIRNYHPERPHLQPCAYKDGKAIVQQLRALHTAGKLSELSEKLLFSPTRPREELYELSADRWQVRNLAEDPAYAAVLADHRHRLARPVGGQRAYQFHRRRGRGRQLRAAPDCAGMVAPHPLGHQPGLG